jgi:hypothetical protein
MPALPLGGPPPEVLVSPEHMHAYAANCRRTLHYAVNGTLLAKRDHILHQIGRLRAKMLEVAHVRGVMERDIQSEASEALQRLASAEALKQMKVQREVDELARHADAINVLAAEVEAVTSAPDAMSSEFLGRYRVRKVSFVWRCRFSNRNRNRISPPGAAVPSADAIPPDVMPRPRALLLRPQAMYDACDRLARRPLPEPAEVNALDFEREARVYTAASKERDALSRLLAVKDNMIWTLVEERDAAKEELADAQREIDQLKEELDEMRAAAGQHTVVYAEGAASGEAAELNETAHVEKA